MRAVVWEVRMVYMYDDQQSRSPYDLPDLIEYRPGVAWAINDGEAEYIIGEYLKEKE